MNLLSHPSRTAQRQICGSLAPAASLHKHLTGGLISNNKPRSARRLGKFEKIYMRVVKEYVKFYPEHSFQFYLDDLKHPVIGSSSKVVEIRFTNAEETIKRIFTGGSLGVGESFCEGLIKVADEDYKEFILMFARLAYNKKLLFKLPFFDMLRILKAIRAGGYFTYNDQYKNISTHYSLSEWFEDEEDSNSFFLRWLNSNYIHYSCGKWDKDTKTLEESQTNKLEFYAERLGINESSKGKTLLDLGCGWGGLIFYFAEKYGVICKGLTLSRPQAKYIREEAKRRNLGDKISVEVKNIHDMEGKYDFIVCVGVLEHIDDYDDLYKKSAKALKKGGAGLFHSIFWVAGFIEKLFYKPDPFILKYIFPGGGVPYLDRNLKILRKHFSYVDRNDLPYLSYPKTLDCWYRNFCANENEIRKLLKEKGACKDVEYAIRIFKHYLTLAYCGHTQEGALVSNIVVKN
jgi:cyclopropane-fatty-acyl-phospholipid synthase